MVLVKCFTFKFAKFKSRENLVLYSSIWSPLPLVPPLPPDFTETLYLGDTMGLVIAEIGMHDVIKPKTRQMTMKLPESCHYKILNTNLNFSKMY